VLALPGLAAGLKLFVQGLQFGQFGVSGFGGNHARRVALQQAQQVVHVGQVVGRHFGHIGATAHLHGDQAFGGQHLQRFAQGGAADAVFLGKTQLVNPAAWLQLALEDALAQQLGHFFIEALWAKGTLYCAGPWIVQAGFIGRICRGL
jgi:hypothetical protein